MTLRTAAHWVWRRLPPRFRRRLFVSLQKITAPRPDARVSQPLLPVVVAGVLRDSSGLGQSARMNLSGMERASLKALPCDISDSLLGRPDLPSALPSAESSAGPGSLIVHVSGPFMPYALKYCGRRAVKDKYIIGVWHWELEHLPEDWRVGCDFVHEVWVPSQFCANAVHEMFSGPVRVVPHPVALDMEPPPIRSGDGAPFTVVTMFNMASGFERKNPLACVRAFKTAFGQLPDARLVIKMLNADHYPAGAARLAEEIAGHPNIKLLTQVMSREQVKSFLASADAICSLHRSEGFGLLAAEGMALGKPVLSTDWSATTDFVTPENGVPIPYRLTAANDPQHCYHFPDQQWADADIDAAAMAMKRLRDDPAWAAQIGANARETVQRLMSPERYAQTLRGIFASTQQ